jgi:hypothetical protein
MRGLPVFIYYLLIKLSGLIFIRTSKVFSPLVKDKDVFEDKWSFLTRSIAKKLSYFYLSSKFDTFISNFGPRSLIILLVVLKTIHIGYFQAYFFFRIISTFSGLIGKLLILCLLVLKISTSNIFLGLKC